MLEEEDELATAVFLNEVVEWDTRATHNENEVVLARGGDITFLGSSRESRDVVRLEVVWYLTRFHRNGGHLP